MAAYYNGVRFTTATTGAGSLTVGSAVAPFRTPAAAGVPDGVPVAYAIVDGANWEEGRGVFSSSGTVLSRGPSDSTNAGAAINLTGGAQVFITPDAQDLNALNSLIHSLHGGL